VTRPADWRERRRALDPGRSLIVQAPAGSGKTELLTQRLLGLLARVEQPEEIIAITFTRKAAAEMRNRLLEELWKAADAKPGEQLEPHKQISRELALAALRNDEERAWHLLKQPSRLRIRTIDSLCSDLARQLPILSGLGGGQQISSDTDTLYRAAATRTMAVIEDDAEPLQADVKRVLNRYDNQYDRLVDLLTDMLGHRDQWTPHLLGTRHEGGFDRAGLEDSLRYLVEAQLRTAAEEFPPELLAELPTYLRHASRHHPSEGEALEALLDAFGDWQELKTTADMLPHWNTLLRLLMTTQGTWRKGVNVRTGFPAASGAKGEEKALREEMNEGFNAWLDRLRDNDLLLGHFVRIGKLPEPHYEDEAWHSLESLMRILLRAAGEWELVMAESGEADFNEVALRAIRALGSENQPSDLALRMDYRVRHLLIDEFQDTSHTQIRLLERLTAGWTDGDGRTLFLVGDPMQSIYRFRKAEVSLFLQAFEGQLLPNIRLEPLRLTVNFRSNEPLVAWVNRVFPAIMPERSDPIIGAVSYSEARAGPAAPGSGAVSVDFSPVRSGAEEALEVLRVIESSDPQDTIAILVRSRSHAAEIISLLDRLKGGNERLRYQAIDFTKLADTTLIRDLVSLTLALAQPADRLAWLSTLRAPWFGLGLADLEVLVGARHDGIVAAELQKALDGDPAFAALSDDGRDRLLRCGPVLIDAAASSGRRSLRSLLQSTWTRLGGPACLSNDSELEDAKTYFDLLETLEERGLPIDRDSLEQGMESLHARPDSLASGKLQIMTVYTAKGLQFDTVILPGLNRGTGGDSGKLLHWFELADENRIVLSPMRNAQDKEQQKRRGDLIQFISDVEKGRQAMEDGRLLYVACTRAISRLALFAEVKPGARMQFNPKAGTLLRELWPAVRAEQLPLLEAALENSSAAEDEQAGVSAPGDEHVPHVPQKHRRLAAGWSLPSPPAAVSVPALDPDEPQDVVEFRWAGEDARLTGNLVHRLLQLVAELGPDNWESRGGMAARENWCRRQLHALGVQGEKAGGIIDQAARAVDRCLSSECGRWIVAPHEHARSEYAVTAVVDGRLRSLAVDRTFVDGGVRWIIDYKTSTHTGGNLEGFLANEADRYREQLERYRAAFAVAETRPINTALYFPLLDRLQKV
jgi:ATP-dependent exoDNAse (exonuclease V) beta subunit